LTAEKAPLSAVIVELTIELVALQGKAAWAERPGPARVGGAAKDKLLAIVDEAMAADWSLRRVCSVLQIDRRRVRPW